MGRDLKAILATEIGTRAYLRVYESGESVICPHYGYHESKILLNQSDKLEDWTLGGKESDYADSAWPEVCDHCGATMHNPIRQVFHERLYDTPSGNLEPGCLYWDTWLPEDFVWSNHKGGYLHAVLPNGRHWNIDSRASNCGSPGDATHRCWIRHGDPPDITVDKAGLTCSAGAGSIIAGDWHGFLQNGFFKEC